MTLKKNDILLTMTSDEQKYFIRHQMLTNIISRVCFSISYNIREQYFENMITFLREPYGRVQH